MLHSFRLRLAEALLQVPTTDETAEIAVRALGKVNELGRPLNDQEWRQVIGEVMGVSSLPPPRQPGIKTAGLDFSGLNTILVHIQPKRGG